MQEYARQQSVHCNLVVVKLYKPGLDKSLRKTIFYEEKFSRLLCHSRHHSALRLPFESLHTRCSTRLVAKAMHADEMDPVQSIAPIRMIGPQHSWFAHWRNCHVGLRSYESDKTSTHPRSTAPRPQLLSKRRAELLKYAKVG